MKNLIELPTNPKIVSEDKKNHISVFEIAPCYPGYGLTLGNAFRRVLLSSLEGAAVSSIKIEKVSHEFSGIPFVEEDVIQIMLNFKKLRLKMFSEDSVILTLNAKGQKSVTAKDIKSSSSVEIVNPDLHIATLTDKRAQLSIEIEVQKGIGYSNVEEREKEKQGIGKILLDAIYTPIRRVNYRVENMRVHDRTDFNKLILEIETDGTIEPKEAFIQGAKILVDHFQVFVNPKKEKKVKAKKEEKTEKKKFTKRLGLDLASMTIDDLKLPPRVHSILRDNRIKGVKTLAKKSEEQLLELGGLGEKAVKDIRRELGKLGLLLKQ